MADEDQEKSMDTTDRWDCFAAAYVLHPRICGAGIHRAGCCLYREEIMACSNRDDQEEKKIIGTTRAKEETIMVKARYLGKINRSILEKEFGELQTNEIIVTDERIDHIKEKHSIDYDLFEKYSAECVQNPDYIVKDNKNKGTVFMIMKLPDKRTEFKKAD